MRKWNLVFLTAGLILTSWAQARIGQDVPPVAQQVAEKIQTAIQNYKDGKIPEGAASLCDVVLKTRPASSWPGGFEAAMGSARGMFLKGQFSEGVGFVRQAIKLFKPDYEEAPAEGSGSTAGLAQLALNKIESALENFKTGNADQAVLLILESLTLLGPAH